MAGGRRGPLFAALLAAWVVAVAEAEADQEQAARPPERSLVRPMTASNWTLVMEGEWMLKFCLICEDGSHTAKPLVPLVSHDILAVM
ncbi:TMX4 [Cervus elaphus hippelaphus]|uniref:TMX4 n=1 Tax=Cervus elaphus hippelaphus TaxID=46360 RepID=A0A212CBK8_CEREH|nr:TMX4 [Cervus elaphus hippelaphus]